MADTKDTGEKTLRVAPSKTLTIKRSVEQGTVRQSFSHGRTKAVVVEKVKRRVVGAGAEAQLLAVALEDVVAGYLYLSPGIDAHEAQP